MRPTIKKMGRACVAVAAMASSVTLTAESLPRALSGTWRITKVLPTTNKMCWSQDRAAELLGTSLSYRGGSMHWNGGDVPLQGITTRTLTAAQFRKENAGPETPADFAQLGIRAASVTEVDMQHDDMDITGSTTEVPGDSVLLVSPARIVVSACGVYFEATRGGAARASINR